MRPADWTPHPGWVIPNDGGTCNRILVDHARHQHRDKRGGGAAKLSLDEAIGAAEPEADVDLLGLDQALTSLALIDPRAARIIELRFFSGLTIDETAAVLDISAGTVKREWSAARAWLFREIRPSVAEG